MLAAGTALRAQQVSMLQSGKAETCYAHLVSTIYPKPPEGPPTPPPVLACPSMIASNPGLADCAQGKLKQRSAEGRKGSKDKSESLPSRGVFTAEVGTLCSAWLWGLCRLSSSLVGP